MSLAKRVESSNARAVVCMLPLRTVDDIPAKRRMVNERIAALSKVRSRSLRDVRDVAIGALGRCLRCLPLYP
jgi:hypothetical protein